MKFAVFAALSFAGIVGCTKKEVSATHPAPANKSELEPPEIKTLAKAASPPPSRKELKLRGGQIYSQVCIVCHNPNPTKVGSSGPPIFGSSREILEAKVLRGEYPEGYQPKRDTMGMPAFPHLEKDIPALHAFLNAN